MEHHCKKWEICTFHCCYECLSFGVITYWTWFKYFRKSTICRESLWRHSKLMPVIEHSVLRQLQGYSLAFIRSEHFGFVNWNDLFCEVQILVCVKRVSVNEYCLRIIWKKLTEVFKTKANAKDWQAPSFFVNLKSSLEDLFAKVKVFRRRISSTVKNPIYLIKLSKLLIMTVIE